MVISKVILSAIAPTNSTVLWAKPLKNGFALYIMFNGTWQPLKMMDGSDTISTLDDEPIDVTNLPSIDSLQDKIQEEVAAQMATHDATVGDTHNEPSGDENDYPDVSPFISDNP